jgi:hypothetical protein
LWFAAGFVGIAVLAAVLSGTLPIPVAIATVFLFAGPHNWFEARYALGRIPARAGKLRGFFWVSFTGIIGLTASYAALPWLTEDYTTPAEVGTAYAIWNTAFVFWIASLIWMRSRTNPRFDGGWVWPLACLICAGVWLNPLALNIALVYVHPMMALWLLDRELTRSHIEWRRTYRCVVGCAPLLLLALWWHLRDPIYPAATSSRASTRSRSSTTPGRGSLKASRSTSSWRRTRSWSWCITVCGCC